MSFTTDDSNLFQSDAQHTKSAIRQAKSIALSTTGQPIQLSSKPLHVLISQDEEGEEPEAFIGESGFIIRRINLLSGKTKQIYRGHQGPVTCLAFYEVKGRNLLLSGSWDKCLKVWDIKTKTCLSTTIGHSDFIKTLVVIPELECVVTGSSDKDVKVWDLKRGLEGVDFDRLDLTTTTSTTTSREEEATTTTATSSSSTTTNPLPLLLRLKSHTRPIEQLGYFHFVSSNSSSSTTTSNHNGKAEEKGEEEEDREEISMRTRTGKIGLISCDSMGVTKIWELSPFITTMSQQQSSEGSDSNNSGSGKGDRLKGEEKCSVRDHELAIYSLSIGQQGEMWTASADGSILLSYLSLTSPTTRPIPMLRIPHPNQNRALLHLPTALSSSSFSYNSSSSSTTRTTKDVLIRPEQYPYLLTTTSNDDLIRIFNLDDQSDSLQPCAKREVRREWKGISGLREGDSVEGCLKELEGHTNDIVQLSTYTISNTTVEGEEGKKKSQKKELWILSVSLDGTLRRWNFERDMLKSEQEKLVIVPVIEEEKTKKKESLLTEEEERELEELMMDD